MRKKDAVKADAIAARQLHASVISGTAPEKSVAAGADHRPCSRVPFADRTPSKFFYRDDVASRRLRPERMSGHEALEQAKAIARIARDDQ
jgi:hypothetical protein